MTERHEATSQPAEPCCPPLLGSFLSEPDAARLATTLKALADPVRLRLVNIIARAGEGCACDFPAALGRTQPTISHHLSILVKAGLLDREQRGKWAWFRVNADGLAELRSALGEEVGEELGEEVGVAAGPAAAIDV